MKRYLALLAILLSTVASAASPDAKTTSSGFNVQHDGVPQFCAPQLQVINGAYNFIGTCAVTPPPPPAAGRQLNARVCYNYNLPASACINNADITQAAPIWGRTSPADPIIGYPFKNFFAIFANMQKTLYGCALVNVPIGTNPNIGGLFSHGETLPGPNVTMAITDSCGNFAPTQSICLRSNQPPGGILVKYKTSATQPGNACLLAPRTQPYAINWKFTNPPATHQDCAGTTCKVTIQNNSSIHGVNAAEAAFVAAKAAQAK